MKLTYGDPVDLLLPENSLTIIPEYYITVDFNNSNLWPLADILFYGKADLAFADFDSDDYGNPLFELACFRARNDEVSGADYGIHAETTPVSAGSLLAGSVAGLGIFRNYIDDGRHWIRVHDVRLGVKNRFAIKIHLSAGNLIYGAEDVGGYVADSGYGIILEPWGYK